MHVYVALIFVLLGAIMGTGRLPPNPLVGVRLRWTLADAEVWRASNRVAGVLLWLWALCLLLAPEGTGRSLLALLLPMPFFLVAVVLHAAWTYRSRHGGLDVPRRDEVPSRDVPWPSSLVVPMLGVVLCIGASHVAGKGGPPFLPTLFAWTGAIARVGAPGHLLVHHGLAVGLLAVLVVVARRLRAAGARRLEGPFFLFMVAAMLLAEGQVLAAHLMGRGLLAHGGVVLLPLALFLVFAAGRLLVVLHRSPTEEGGA